MFITPKLNNYNPIPTLPVGIENAVAIFKTTQQALLSVEYPGIFYSWSNGRGKKAFFGGCKKWNHIVRLPLRALGCQNRLKSFSFCEI